VAQFEVLGVRDGTPRGEGWGVEGGGGGGGDGGVRGWLAFAACGAGFYFPKGTTGSVEYDEGPSWRAARGGVVLSHSSLDWQRRLDPKDAGCLYFVKGGGLLLSRYPQRNW